MDPFEPTNFNLPAAPRAGMAPIEGIRFTIYAGQPASSAMNYPVIAITTSAHKRTAFVDQIPPSQRYRFHLAILLDASQFPCTDHYYRFEGYAATRKDAIKAIRTFLMDSFNQVPERTTLRLERGKDLPFPADPAHPFARKAA